MVGSLLLCCLVWLHVLWCFGCLLVLRTLCLWCFLVAGWGCWNLLVWVLLLGCFGVGVYLDLLCSCVYWPVCWCYFLLFGPIVACGWSVVWGWWLFVVGGGVVLL